MVLTVNRLSDDLEEEMEYNEVFMPNDKIYFVKAIELLCYMTTRLEVQN